MQQIPIPFINLQISNEDMYVELEDKAPSVADIHNYVTLFAGALQGLTFSKAVIRKGFEQWLEEN